jgi:branched-chain amino acid transport system substrate-binding protein
MVVVAMITSLTRSLACCALAVGSLFAGASASAQTSTVKVAVPTALSGSGEFAGRAMLEAVRFALDEANAEGKGPRVELDVVDDHSSEEGARAAARQIVASDALVVLGPNLTVSSLAAGPIFAQGGIVSLVPTAHGDAITNNATSFRTVFSTGEIGNGLANYFKHVAGGTRAVVLFRDNGYGRPFAEGFRAVAERHSIATVYHAFTTAAEREEATRLAAGDPAQPAIFLGMTFEDAVPMMVSLRRLGTKGMIYGTATMARAGFVELFKDQPEYRANPNFFTDGVYATSPVIFDSANAATLAFAERYRSGTGKEPSWETVQAYEVTRLAVTALRAAFARPDLPPDVRARREAVQSFLISLDSPAHAVEGLTGSIWFTPERVRRQAVRIGSFHGAQFESAPVQLYPVWNPNPDEVATGALIDMGGGLMARRQKVVYSGIYLNEIPRLDVAQSTFTADLYLWMRFAQAAGPGDDADPTAIDFPDLLKGNFNAKRPAIARDLDDGTTYRLWRMRGEFKNDFDLHRYPFDRQSLAVRFFNSRAASDRLVYVQDTRAAGSGAGAPSIPVAGAARASLAVGAANAAEPPSGRLGGNIAPLALRDLTQWDPLHSSEQRDILVTKSALGDPELVGVDRIRELSGFSATVDLHRRVAVTLIKTLLPLGLMMLIVYASLYFPHALVKEKVTVVVTAALAGNVLLAAINAQLGGIGYVMVVEYVFYAFFALCLLCIILVLAAEQFRHAKRASAAIAVERGGRYVYLLGVAATVAVAWSAYMHS